MKRSATLSLAVQLSLLLIAALVAAQLAAFALLSGDKSEVFQGATRTRAIEQVAILARAIDASPAGSADGLAKAFNTRQHHFWIAASSIVDAGKMDNEETDVATILSRHLKGAAQDPRVSLVESDSERHFRRHSKRPQAVQISVKLPDGQWLNEEAAFRLTHGRRVIYLLLASILAILVVVMFVVRRITRPLSALALAAERLGRGEEVSPLAASGPSEVRRLVGAFNDMRQRLKRFLDDRVRLLAAISHDLRTPITALRLRTELIDDPELRAAMSRTLLNMQRMVEASLSFARDDALLEETRTVDLAALIDATADDFIAAGSDVTLDVPDRLLFRCRPTALRRAIGNVIENAVRYGKRAQVAVNATQSDVRITIDDDGPGLPEDKLEVAFGPFVRIDESRSEETGGIGLGLAIVRSVVRAHGGNIVLSNRKEGGLRAEMTLPLSSPLAKAADNKMARRGNGIESQEHERT